MYQEIFKDTLGGRFIKSLLSETALPIYTSVSPGDYIVANQFYYYRSHIIKCTTTGIIGDGAEFTQIKYFDENDQTQAHKYLSYANYYDSDTHYYLGKYLRYYKSKTGVNLFPYYNCYCKHSISDVQLEVQTYTKNEVTTTGPVPVAVDTQTYRVVGFPILINKHYRIAIDCPAELKLRCIWRNSSGFVFDRHVLSDSLKIVPSSSFKRPFDYCFSSNDSKIIAHQPCTWLIIQMPKNNNSSVVVYEDINLQTSTSKNIISCDMYNDIFRHHNDNVLNPALTFINTQESYAFSNRLLEYLLNGVICSDNRETSNFGKVQKVLKNQGKLNPNFKVKDIWSAYISDEVYNSCLNYAEDNFILDQDGNINKDVEKNILTNKGGVIW